MATWNKHLKAILSFRYKCFILNTTTSERRERIGNVRSIPSSIQHKREKQGLKLKKTERGAEKATGAFNKPLDTTYTWKITIAKLRYMPCRDYKTNDTKI